MVCCILDVNQGLLHKDTLDTASVRPGLNLQQTTKSYDVTMVTISDRC